VALVLRLVLPLLLRGLIESAAVSEDVFLLLHGGLLVIGDRYWHLASLVAGRLKVARLRRTPGSATVRADGRAPILLVVGLKSSPPADGSVVGGGDVDDRTGGRGALAVAVK
jgi:hypothetical protein